MSPGSSRIAIDNVESYLVESNFLARRWSLYGVDKKLAGYCL